MIVVDGTQRWESSIRLARRTKHAELPRAHVVIEVRTATIDDVVQRRGSGRTGSRSSRSPSPTDRPSAPRQRQVLAGARGKAPPTGYPPALRASGSGWQTRVRAAPSPQRHAREGSRREASRGANLVHIRDTRSRHGAARCGCASALDGSSAAPSIPTSRARTPPGAASASRSRSYRTATARGAHR